MMFRWMRKLWSGPHRTLPPGDLGPVELCGSPADGTYHFEIDGVQVTPSIPYNAQPGWQPDGRISMNAAGQPCVLERSQEMKPSIGRMVHYVSHGTPIREDGTQAYRSQCRAAIITERQMPGDEDDPIGLCVLNPTGMFFHSVAEGGCLFDPGSGTAAWSCDARGHAGGSWHWPARVEE